MVAKKIKTIQFLKTLKVLNKSYFTVADLEKILGLKRESLYVVLSRLVKCGALTRLKRGVYQSEFQSFEPAKIANELYYPSYLSFESALSQYSILSQIPYCLTFATTNGSKKITLGKTEIEYRQLKDSYFFGYVLKEGIYIAELEKAIADQLYMISKGRAVDSTAEWSLVGLDKDRFLQYAKKFPNTVYRKAKSLIPKLGKQVVSV